MPRTRRCSLRLLGAGLAVGLAGCLGDGTADGPASGGASTSDDGEAADASEAGTGAGSDGVPISDRELPLPADTDAIVEGVVNGGVGKDGIPSIENPSFLGAGRADEWLSPEEPVFGYVRNGEAKAYPQRVLVWHEIVNDVIGGDTVSVTYCPLTGTVQGYERGDGTFGVSGKLINSNLVMYHRGTNSYVPQMLATGITGPHEGDVFQEFQVTWTSWGRWRDAHPETAVLSDDTGFARDYARDPYGTYTPERRGHYAGQALPFEPFADSGLLEESDIGNKDVVLGARSADGALAVLKERVREAGLVETTVGGVPYAAVYEPSLDTGHVYRNPDGTTLAYEDGTARVEGEAYAADALPLERVIRYDSMWFAWAGYYPDTAVVA